MYVVNLIIFLAFLILLIISKNKYKKYFVSINKKQHKLSFLYELSLFFLNLFPNKYKWNRYSRVEESLILLKEDKQLYQCQKIALVLLVVIIFNNLSFIMWINERNNNLLVDKKYIARSNYGDGEQSVELAVKMDEKYVGQIKLNVEARQYGDKELKVAVDKAKKYIDNTVCGNNESLNKVTDPLYLANQIPNANIQVEWITDEKGIIDSKGNLYNSNLKKGGELTKITAVLKYNQVVVEYPVFLRVMPKKVSLNEKMMQLLKEEIVKFDKASVTKYRMILPRKLGNKKITYVEKADQTKEYLLIVGIIIAVALYFGMDKELEKKIRRREIELLIDYPEIINKFTLLLGAGMTMKNAWGRIAGEYGNKVEQGLRAKRFAYEEMLVTWHEILNGVTETTAFENFGKRIKLLPYLKFGSLISQNIRKGSKGLLDLLEYEAMNAFEERKELSKRLGEEAGTKLLVPMILMLIIVLIIVMVPAFISL